MGAQEASLVADKIVENNIPLIVNPINNIPNSFDELASNINMTPILEKAGATLMFNVSRSHNYHLIRQDAEVAVANGMSYGGTVKHNKQRLKIFIDRGSIKVGNMADIVVWEAVHLNHQACRKSFY